MSESCTKWDRECGNIKKRSVSLKVHIQMRKLFALKSVIYGQFQYNVIVCVHIYDDKLQLPPRTRCASMCALEECIV